MSNNKNLLCITPVPPLPILDGSSLRIQNLLKNLQSQWNVHIICPNTSSQQYRERIQACYGATTFVDQSVNLQANPYRFHVLTHVKNILLTPRHIYALNFPIYQPNMRRNIMRILENHCYDALYVFGAYTYAYYMSGIPYQNVTCDVCDSTNLFIISLLKRKLKARKNYRECLSLFHSYLYNRKWERKYLRSCKKLVVVSERDKTSLSKSVPRETIYVVENGIDREYWNPEVALPGTEKDLIIFTGVMNYEPNHDAMVYCLERIWPLIKKQIPTAKLKIVGRNPRPDLVALAKKQKDVEMTGQVEDIRKAVQGARIFLCPIRIGSGMKNKILESLAMGIPVITTSEGAAGIKFENGRVGYIADTNESFAQYTLDLLTSKKKWESFSKAARESVEKEYTWESKSQRLSSILLA